MHNVLFSILYIKRGGGAKALLSIYTHIHVYAPQDVCREIMMSMQATAVISCYIKAYAYQ